MAPFSRDSLPWLVAGGALAVVVWAERKEISEGVTDMFVRGKRLGLSSVDSNTGLVVQPPESLRARASIDAGEILPMDVYALARMIRSEGAAQGLARAHVALNDFASGQGWSSLFSLLTYSTDKTRRNLFGEQFNPVFIGPNPATPQYPTKGVRRYSTSRDPYQGDVAAAKQAIAENAAGVDPTGGAVKFVDKSSFGVQAGTGSFDALKKRWEADGLLAYNVPAYGDDLVFFRKA